MNGFVSEFKVSIEYELSDKFAKCTSEEEFINKIKIHNDIKYYFDDYIKYLLYGIK